MDANHYRLTSTWRLPAPPERVYRTLRDVPGYPHWWPQVRQVVPLDERTGQLRIRSLLPYQLLVTAHERRQDPPPAFGRGDPHPSPGRGDPHSSPGRGDPHPSPGRRDPQPPAGVLEAELTGDLVGWSRWTVHPAGAGAAVAVFEEEVRPGKALMRRLALPGRPLFLANHALMMRAGERGLRRLLARGPGG
ncbi:SRPBCC family protein [Kitasatospora sp. NPDC058965]|uniref:SRPBCC family protein n=1 Tax=Kitasatospora sp. NPDC058965 TaxID=3346682 RepID=UPI00367A70F6